MRPYDSQQKSIISAQGMIGGKTAAPNLGTELEQVQIWNKSRVNLSIGASERKRLEQNLRDFEALKAEILKSLEPLAKSPLVAAAREPVVVVFVPYGELDEVPRETSPISVPPLACLV